MTSTTPRYLRPGKGTKVANAFARGVTKLGISLWGSRVLGVRGRTSGQLREVPVNLLTHEGAQYLVAARGETQWVRNLRAAGEGQLRLGRRVEKFGYRELADDEKPAVLRAYLARWKFEVGVFFDGVDASSPDETLRRIAPGYPVFEIRTA
ncbi:nitroreductase family deazaflavin-dependent oxidoreductase [Amycolatopsis jiangsuensis]|uniref:Deazaflavin-dependent oxidoreductase (Nitroreductase family) n=1 Tax=Amycolatopsis jiangsuensis TaxID=1181879 RepID=A0A840J2C9_9PSEU|nr:nitroreductase family deazaflavin-dependent oxidoreductase [Amycolatopsis jiangsuensis]MBB4687637.1 deazaflavin-dependent oxidoreductase (nitroreductase family) [Amycolatopsis jiangsuensis]